ncbi:MAG: PAS domain S-box protein [Fibrobacterota bacterium]|nr:PAS domain S-box protein [Fibrobacterota bacterium]
MDTNPSAPRQEPGLPDAFFLLMRSIGDYAIIIMDLKGTILDWNTGATRIFGFEPGETIGKSTDLLFPPEAIKDGVTARELETALTKGRGGEERWNRRKDGTTFWGTSAVYPLKREDGEAVGYVKLMRDSSARRDTSDVLLDSENKMDLVLENLKDHAIFLVNKEGLIVSWNKGTERVFGYNEAEALGKPFSTIFTPEDILAGIPNLELVKASADGKAEDERWHQRKDGSRFWASGAVLPIPSEQEKSHFIKVLRDATDRKRSEDADRMASIGRLAGGVAHDYNNMLTSIIGYCELLADSIPQKDNNHQEWIGEMLSSANRAAALTRDLLAFSRKQMNTPEPVNLNEIIHKMEGLFRMTLGGHIQLSTELDPGLENALLDKGQIEQVLLNLALNAREAMPDGGNVTITTASYKTTAKAAISANTAGAASAASNATALSAASAAALAGERPPEPDFIAPEGETKPYVTLTFRDNGKGMDAETASHAFDPFFSTKPKSTGSVGLGLSTGYGIIQQSGGTISLSSVPGKGTEFVIHLPVFAENASDPRLDVPLVAKPAMMSGLEGGRKETILVVEDESAVRKLASAVLRKSGFQILEAKDGEEGLAIFNAKSQQIDLVLTDVVMPKMSGLAMARQILSRHPEVPIVFMSGYSEDALLELDMPDRNCVFLPKPFSVVKLLEKIAEAINTRQVAAKKP